MAVSMFTMVSAADDVLMIYDGERDTDVAGEADGRDLDYFTEGKSGYGCSNLGDYVALFVNTIDYWGHVLDVSSYEYIEFDIFSWYEMVCDFNFGLVNNVESHHGNDYLMEDIYLPEKSFVHVKMPIKDFVVLSLENKEPYDIWREANDENGWVAGDTHYGGHALNHVERIRFQLSFCTGADGKEIPCDDVYVVFDNVIATKNGAGEESTLQLWKDVKEEVLGPSQPSVTTPTDVTATDVTPTDVVVLGDLNGDTAVDAKDALVVLKSAVGKETLNDHQKMAAELNGDGSIDAKDALLILRKAVSKIDKFPVEE